MRSRSAQALTDSIRRVWPNATVWGKGDADHQESASDHNEDDTPGSKPEQTDADNLPEHRAVDVPRLGGITMTDLREMRRRLTDRPANRARLRYVILEQTIWRKRNGWKPEDYSGDFHDHLHASVDVADDDNASPYDMGGAPVQPDEGDDDMKMIIGTLQGHATAWSGLRGVAPLQAHSHAESVAALVAAGAVTRTFKSAEALVEALGDYGPEDGRTGAEAIRDVMRAG